MNDLAKKLSQYLLKDDPAIEARIERGIEENRKGDGTIALVGPDGKPVTGAKITLRQLGHEFHFGCNAFMLGEFPEAEQNAQYEETFKELFNLAVIPFYWSDLEPTEGELRFTKDSRPIYRRPPPDRVLEYCEKNGIVPKGHPLLWHLFRPDWLGTDEREMRRKIRRRFRQISERYADRIGIWDVCNEAQTLKANLPQHHMPANHVEFAFELAAEFFPDCTKTYNDDRMWFHYSRTYTPVYLLMRYLLERGYKVDALGLQCHMFQGQWQFANLYLNPTCLFDCLDLYGKLGVPVNFSEVSIISRRDLGDGDTFQKLMTEKLYRIWFSHAAVNGIVWWNMVDGTAAYAPLGSEQGENSLRAGLVNYDFTPKAAYTALHSLVRKEWQTATSIDYKAGVPNQFRGFYGDYEATVQTDAGTTTHRLKLSKRALNTFTIHLG